MGILHLGSRGSRAGHNTSQTLTAQRLKVTTVLDTTELLAVTAPDGKPRITLRIRLPERTLTADIAAKSLRKAQTAIRDAGADDIALVLQGRLAAGAIAEAGLSAAADGETKANPISRPVITHRRSRRDEE